MYIIRWLLICKKDNKLKIKNKNSQWYFKTNTKLKCKRYEAILIKAKNKKNT